MSETKKRLLTGLQSSGTLHIGNYFGALKPFLDIYQDYESYLMVADYHALTSLRNPDELRNNIYNVVKDYLAVGVDPEKAIIFRQSDNQDHMELGWIFDCMVTVPFLMQAHSYKDKVAKGLEPNAGLFTYPMLQAADIALYDIDVVPVGEDQRQHLEYSREAVGKFNRAYGDILKEPKELIYDNVGVVPGTDGAKMSKSYGNTIPLFGSKEEIEKAVMSIVTDSEGKHPEHVYNIHKLLKTEEDLASLYEEKQGRYGDLKKALAEDLEKFIAPMRERREQITDDDVKKVLAEGVERAKEMSHKTIQKVRSAVGINL
ncbi:tryptophan--tRNA ligase [Candidatus Kaiserbacteria bacterium]|uniref:Tryptophan--tRNA ligase n=1 Tax=candidate division WWE3 bacterium TaxID=2053526 RepID=A0A955LW65_UNCKA|nr:tryptophan--tRNA ligase [Candidatus Kaiserbacteria bacterium]MCA9397787.1 tryptophan--tRNA ligase [candidate division WWE3 bacterium]